MAHVKKINVGQGRSRGQVVKGDDSQPGGCEFESQRQMLEGILHIFVHLYHVKSLKKRKRGQNLPILERTKCRLPMLVVNMLRYIINIFVKFDKHLKMTH